MGDPAARQHPGPGARDSHAASSHATARSERRVTPGARDSRRDLRAPCNGGSPILADPRSAGDSRHVSSALAGTLGRARPPRALAVTLGWEAPPPGFEPGTLGLEVRCSIQLSYGGRHPRSPCCGGAPQCALLSSHRPPLDSRSRPRRPWARCPGGCGRSPASLGPWETGAQAATLKASLSETV